MFGVAGLWERLESGDQSLESCLVLTTAAEPRGRSHPRAHAGHPDPASYAKWLDPSPREGSAVAARLRTLAEDALESYTVSPW